jgi:hypothetical protein
MKLVLEGQPNLAASIMQEHLPSDADKIDGICALSHVAINNMEDEALVDGLAKVTKILEESLNDNRMY